MGKSRLLNEFMLWPFLETEVNNCRGKEGRYTIRYTI